MEEKQCEDCMGRGFYAVDATKIDLADAQDDPTIQKIKCELCNGTGKIKDEF